MAWIAVVCGQLLESNFGGRCAISWRQGAPVAGTAVRAPLERWPAAPRQRIAEKRLQLRRQTGHRAAAFTSVWNAAFQTGGGSPRLECSAHLRPLAVFLCGLAGQGFPRVGVSYPEQLLSRAHVESLLQDQRGEHGVIEHAQATADMHVAALDRLSHLARRPAVFASEP